MQVVFHLGAPCTDGDLLIRSLLKDRAMLAERAVIVPPPGRYRSVLRDTSRALKGRAATPELQNALVDAIVDEPEVERLVLSDPRFICINRLVVQGAQIWPMIERKTALLKALFPDAEIEFFIGMRDPATLIPALFRASRFTDFQEFVANMQPHALAWSETLRRLRIAHPDCRVTVWCNEDMPFLWGEVLHRMAALSMEVDLNGMNDLLETIMEPSGFNLMTEHLASHPAPTEAERRTVVADYLERYAREEAIEEVLDLPGWSRGLIVGMSASYDQDMSVIARIPGVALLMP